MSAFDTSRFAKVKFRRTVGKEFGDTVGGENRPSSVSRPRARAWSLSEHLRCSSEIDSHSMFDSSFSSSRRLRQLQFDCMSTTQSQSCLGSNGRTTKRGTRKTKRVSRDSHMSFNANFNPPCPKYPTAVEPKPVASPLIPSSATI